MMGFRTFRASERVTRCRDLPLPYSGSQKVGNRIKAK